MKRLALAMLVSACAIAPCAAAETPREAVQRLSQVIKKQPADMAARRQIADSFLKMGLSVRAVEQLQIVMQYGQRSVDDYLLLADAQKYSGKYSESIRTYQEVLNQSPANAKALCGIASCYMLTGDSNTATKMCNIGLKQVDAAGKRDLNEVLRKIDHDKAQAELDRSLSASSKG